MALNFVILLLMAVAFRSTNYINYASRTNTTVPAPAGIVNSDILLLALAIGRAGGTPPAPTFPAGWTVIAGPSTEVDAGAFQVTRRLAWKVASGESGDYLITHTVASTSAVILCVSGGNTGVTPISSNNGRTAGGTNTLTRALSITTTVANSYVAFMVHGWGFYGAALPPTGYTERSDPANGLCYAADNIFATAGATGDATHTNPSTNVSDRWGAFLVGIGPATAGSKVRLVSPTPIALQRRTI